MKPPDRREAKFGFSCEEKFSRSDYVRGKNVGVNIYYQDFTASIEGIFAVTPVYFRHVVFQLLLNLDS